MLAAALVARLQFRKLLFQGISKLQRKQKQDLDMAHKLFLKALTELDNIRDSMHLASSDILGFDESLNSHLDPPVPPRVVKVGWSTLHATFTFHYHPVSGCHTAYVACILISMCCIVMLGMPTDASALSFALWFFTLRSSQDKMHSHTMKPY